MESLIDSEAASISRCDKNTREVGAKYTVIRVDTHLFAIHFPFRYFGFVATVFIVTGMLKGTMGM